jgi:hypothetical protein
MSRPCKKAARHLPAARRETQRLQGEEDAALVQADAVDLLAGLDDLHVSEIKTVKEGKKCSKTYTYGMSSRREGNKTRNVHLGSSKKMDAEEALQKARKMKAEAIHVN